MNNENERIRKQYAEEARKRWDNNAAFKESEQSTANYTSADWSKLSAGMDAIMAGFAELKNEGFASDDKRAFAS